MSASTTEARAVVLLLLLAAVGCGPMASGSAGTRTFEATRVSPAPLWSRDLGRAVETDPVEWGDSWLVAVTAGPLRRVRQSDGEDVWKQKLKGAVRGAPVVVEPVVAVALERGAEEVLAVDLESGKPRWRHAVAAALLAGGSNRLLAAGEHGTVSCFAPASGDLLWTATVWGAGWRPPVWWDGAALWLVPVRPDSVIALEAETGARRWARAVGSWPLLAAGAGGAYAATDDSLLVRLAPEDGGVLARRSLGAMPAGPPVPGSGRIHVSLRNGTILALSEDLVKEWETTLEPPLTGAPVVSGGDLFQAGTKGRVFRLDAATGARRSEYLHAEFLVAGPAVTGDRVAVAGDGGRLIAYPREAAP